MRIYGVPCTHSDAQPSNSHTGIHVCMLPYKPHISHAPGAFDGGVVVGLAMTPVDGGTTSGGMIGATGG